MAGLQLNVTSSIESGLQTLALYIREYQLNSMGDDLTSTDEYDDKDLFNGTASGAANSGCINDDRHQVKPQKHRCIRSDVYEYYEMSPIVAYNANIIKLMHWLLYSLTPNVLGRNTSNLNKHRSKCCGCFSAWESKFPGSIDPSLGAKLAAEEQVMLQKSLVEALVAIQVSFSIFETPRLRQILHRLSPTFVWPRRRQIAALATDLYFERKQKLIEEVANLPQGTYLSAAIDCWTTKDQTQSYVAM
ncbi:hypothetical protein O181_047002, partial [Austropuccinia psidii MF-1]|nr:hypothetical protein [Austropuccinia psidii MF-1]